MVLYDEHTWGSHWAIKDPHSEQAEQQLATKEGFAYHAKNVLTTYCGAAWQRWRTAFLAHATPCWSLTR